MIERLGARAIAAIVFGLFLLAVLIFGVTQCQKRQSADTQAKVSKGQGQASIGAGAEAVNTVGNVAAGDAQTDATVAQGQEAVRNAPDGLKGATARREACKLKTYRDTPQCKALTEAVK